MWNLKTNTKTNSEAQNRFVVVRERQGVVRVWHVGGKWMKVVKKLSVIR